MRYRQTWKSRVFWIRLREIRIQTPSADVGKSAISGEAFKSPDFVNGIQGQQECTLAHFENQKLGSNSKTDAVVYTDISTGVQQCHFRGMRCKFPDSSRHSHREGMHLDRPENQKLSPSDSHRNRGSQTYCKQFSQKINRDEWQGTHTNIWARQQHKCFSKYATLQFRNVLFNVQVPDELLLQFIGNKKQKRDSSEPAWGTSDRLDQ